MEQAAVEHHEAVGAREDGPAVARQRAVAHALLGDERRPAGARREVERRAHDRVAHAAAPLVVAVEVELVARAVRPAVRPPLGVARRLRRREGGAHARVDGADDAVEPALRSAVERHHVREEGRLAARVLVLAPERAVRRKRALQIAEQPGRQRAVDRAHAGGRRAQRVARRRRAGPPARARARVAQDRRREPELERGGAQQRVRAPLRRRPLREQQREQLQRALPRFDRSRLVGGRRARRHAQNPARRAQPAVGTRLAEQDGRGAQHDVRRLIAALQNAQRRLGLGVGEFLGDPQELALARRAGGIARHWQPV